MDNILLSNVLRGRSIHNKIIPTVCNLKNMLTKLENNEWEFSKLKQWEKRSYKAYKIDRVIIALKESSKSNWPEIIKEHILTLQNDEIGASCLDIYFVGYVAEKYGTGKHKIFEYAKEKHITEKMGSANAIYQVGKNDGIYLGLLDQYGRIKDKEFFKQWINR